MDFTDAEKARSRGDQFRGTFRGRCTVCGNRFKVGDQKIANLYEQDDRGVRREYCESCYWGTKRGTQHIEEVLLLKHSRESSINHT